MSLKEPLAQSTKIDAWVSLQGVSVLWEMPEAAWDSAGEAFGKYSKLRKTGTWSRRLVADFLVAAHAQLHALEMLTFDDTVFKAVFPSVALQTILKQLHLQLTRVSSVVS
jgi:predicted nucleic acid-binding protein